MTALDIYQVDAFTSAVFSGNPAAIVPLTQWLSDDLMQSIAVENNLSETAFFVPNNDGSFHLRWFTPTYEIDLCGYATLAAAFIILTELYPDRDTAHCTLAPYWAKHLNKNDLQARQISKRGGDLTLRLDGERLFISGNAMLYLKGQIFV